MTSLFARARAPGSRAGRRDNRRVGRSPHIDARRANERRRRARERDRTRRIDALERRVTSNETRAVRRRGKIPLTREEDVFEI